jgi:predicted transcriptional regulator
MRNTNCPSVRFALYCLMLPLPLPLPLLLLHLLLASTAAQAQVSAGPGVWSSQQTRAPDPVNGGNLTGFFYWPASPASLAGKRALVLHGCLQTAAGDVIDKAPNHGFNWQAMADRYGAVILAPNATGNLYGGHCWDYANTSHSRSSGQNSNDVDATKVHYLAFVMDFWNSNNLRISSIAAPPACACPAIDAPRQALPSRCSGFEKRWPSLDGRRHLPHNGDTCRFRCPMTIPSTSELSLLKALWRQHPLSARELHDHIADELGWSYSSTRKTLERMLNKGFVVQQTLHGVQVYEAALEKVGTLAAFAHDFGRRVMEMHTPLPVNMFTGSKLVNDDELAQLDQLLKDWPEDDTGVA